MLGVCHSTKDGRWFLNRVNFPHTLLLEILGGAIFIVVLLGGIIGVVGSAIFLLNKLCEDIFGSAGPGVKTQFEQKSPKQMRQK